MIVRRSRGLGDLAHPRRVVLAGHRGKGGPIAAVGEARQAFHSVRFESSQADVGDVRTIARIVAVGRSKCGLAGWWTWRQFDKRAKALVLAPVVEGDDEV